MKKKILCLAVTLLLAISVFAGCTGNAQQGDAAENDPAPSSAETAATEDAVEETEESSPAAEGNYPRGNGDDTIKVGYACLDMSNTYHAVLAQYFEKEMERLGVECMILDDKFDGATAVENCQLMVDSGCDIYSGIMGFKVGDTLSEICKEAGVLAIGVDTEIRDYPYFGCDNALAGSLAGEALANAALEKWGDDVEIDLYISLEVLGAGVTNEERMHEGYLTSVRKTFDISEDIYIQCDIVDNDAQLAMRWVEDTINAHPDAEHILIAGYVDDCAQGAEAVIEKLGYQDKAIIASIDGSALAINNFKNPDTAWTIAAALMPELYGYYMMEVALPYIKGEVDELPDSWKMTPVVIEADNYQQVLEDAVKPIYPDFVVE
jgi:ribose transport system substrate-binding protein